MLFEAADQTIEVNPSVEMKAACTAADIAELYLAADPVRNDFAKQVFIAEELEQRLSLLNRVGYGLSIDLTANSQAIFTVSDENDEVVLTHDLDSAVTVSIIDQLENLFAAKHSRLERNQFTSGPENVLIWSHLLRMRANGDFSEARQHANIPHRLVLLKESTGRYPHEYLLIVDSPEYDQSGIHLQVPPVDLDVIGRSIYAEFVARGKLFTAQLNTNQTYKEAYSDDLATNRMKLYNHWKTPKGVQSEYITTFDIIINYFLRQSINFGVANKHIDRDSIRSMSDLIAIVDSDWFKLILLQAAGTKNAYWFPGIEAGYELAKLEAVEAPRKGILDRVSKLLSRKSPADMQLKFTDAMLQDLQGAMRKHNSGVHRNIYQSKGMYDYSIRSATTTGCPMAPTGYFTNIHDAVDTAVVSLQESDTDFIHFTAIEYLRAQGVIASEQVLHSGRLKLTFKGNGIIDVMLAEMLSAMKMTEV
jgi:hypothetical protein